MAAPLSDEDIDKLFDDGLSGAKQVTAAAPPQEGGGSLVNEKPSVDPIDAAFDASDLNVKPANKPSAWGDVLRGIDNLQGTGGGLAALLGNAAGMKGLEDWGTEVYQRNQDEAGENPAAVGSYENIHSAGDLLKYSREAVLENLAMFVPSMATGSIGGVIARKTADTFIKNLAATMTEEQIAKMVAKRVFIGSTLGAYASSAGQEAGSIYSDVVDQTGVKDPAAALGFGAVAGLMDALPEGKLLENVLGPKIGKEVTHGLMRRLGEEGAKQFLREGFTEGLQTIIEEAAIVQADPSQDLFDNKRVASYIDAAVKGGIAGAGMGVAGEAAGSVLRPHPNDLVRMKEKEISDAAAEQAPLEAPEEQITEEDQKLSEIHDKLSGVDQALADPNLTVEHKVRLEDERRSLQEQAALIENPLVNENKGESLLSDEEIKKTAASLELPEIEVREAAGLPHDELEKRYKEAQDAYTGAIASGKTISEIANAGLDSRAGLYHNLVQRSAAKIAPIENTKTNVETSSPSADQVRAKALEQKRSALIEERAYLEHAGENSGQDAGTRNSRMKEIDALLADDQKLNTLDSVPTYSFPETKLPEGLTKERVDVKRGEAHEMIEALVNEKSDPAKSAEYKGAMKAAVEPYMNLLAGEDVRIRKAPKGWSFAANPTAKGGIEILVPSMAEWDARNNREVKRGGVADTLRTIPKVMEEEVIHAAHYAFLRNLWTKGGAKGAFDAFVDKRMKEVGRWLSTSHRGIAPELKAIYSPNAEIDEDRKDFTVGTEFMRMMVQRARTGQLTEDFAIQDRYARNGGIATQALRALTQAAQRIREVIARYLNPATSTPAIQKVYNQVNEVLDRYGVVKPNPEPPVAKAEPRVDNTPEQAPTPQPRRDEENIAPDRSEEERKARESLVNEKRAAQAEKQRGVTEAKKSYEDSLRYARQQVDAKAENATDAVLNAARQHAALQMNARNKLATIASRREAKKRFETALQRKVTQAQYDAAVQSARDTSIPWAAAEAMPEGQDPRQMGDSLGLSYEGEWHGKWQYTNQNTDQPSYGTTIYVPQGTTPEELSEYLDKKNAEFSAPGPKINTEEDLDNYLRSLGISFRSPEMEDLDYQAGTHLDRVFNPLTLVNERERRGIRGGQLRFWDFTPQELEYLSQPKDPTFFAARSFMEEQGGIMRTAEMLLRNPEVHGTELESGERAALYQMTIMGLEKMREEMWENELDYNAEDANEVEDTIDAIERQYAEVGTKFGQFTSNMKGHERFMTGRRARKDYMKAITQQFKRRFGQKGEDMLTVLSHKLNKVAQNAMDKVVTRPEAVAFFRKVLKDLDSKQWRKEMRKTIATQGRKIKAMARKIASRAAEMGFGDLTSEPALKEVARRILNDMTFGIPKQENSEEARTILSSAISEVTRQVAREAGAIPKKEAKTKVAELQKLSEILQNPDMYDQFVMNLEERMANKFGGEGMSDDFMRRMNSFVGNMRSRSWMNGLLESVVNEKMKQMKVSVEKIARQTYGEGIDTIEDVRKALIAELQKDGLTDPEMLNAVAEDLHSMMEDQVERARERWAGSPGAVRKTLREIGETVSKVAKSGFGKRDELANKLAERFVEELGLSNTPDMPHASRLRDIIRKQLQSMVQQEREKVIENALTKAQHPDLAELATRKPQKGKPSPIEKLIEYANMGALDDAHVYSVLAEQLGLPMLSDADLEKVQKWGEKIGNMETGRERTMEIMKLRDFVESKKGVDWKDMLVAGMYSSMLSGPSTHAVNVVSNALNLLGAMYVEGVRRPSNILPMIRATIIGLTRGGALEFKQTIATGLTAGKLNMKVEGGNPLEYKDPVYLDKGAETIGKLLSLTRAKYVVRFLQGADMMFYKAAQELSFASQTGYTEDPDSWQLHLTSARAELQAEGLDVDSRAGQRTVQMRALESMERWRSNLNADNKIAWEESHGNALTTTFNQEPRGWIGKFAMMISKYTAEYPAAKALIPFTRVVANVLNAQIEWSPFGIGRWAFSNDFKIEDADGEMVRDPRILIRSLTATAALGALTLMLAGNDDDDDPYFMIYGSGPKDANKKRQLYERGWKPNTIKIGDTYISYLPTPLSLSLAALGTLMDRRRDNPNISPLDYAPQLAMSFVQGTLNQSFLTGVADLFSAFESSDPETKVQRFIARTLTLPVPNLLKQIDAWADPSVQQADHFLDMVIKQLPVVRQMSDVKPMLNVFGQPVKRVQGPLNIPFSNRFVTMAQTSDPVYGFLAQNALSVPSYSKQTKLGDSQMNEDQFYDYVKQSGPRVYEAIRRAIPGMRNLSKEDKQEKINDIATGIKRQVRSEMKRPLVNEKRKL